MTKPVFSLILPPNPILENPMMQPPLGPLYLAAVLEKNGFGVEIIDLRMKKTVNGNMIPRGRNFYGVSATTGEYYYAREIGEILKHVEPDATTIIGGAHATALPEETLKEMMYDIVVIGEGEDTILELVQNKPFSEIKGIAYREENKVTVNPPRPMIKNLDTIPFPARHLLSFFRFSRVKNRSDRRKSLRYRIKRKPETAFTSDLYYGARYGSGEVATSLITERGCPFRCAYCANYDRKIRFRSVENVVEEVKLCVEQYNCRRFKIIDDEFGMNKQHAFNLMEALEPFKLHFRAATRSDVVSPELLKAMKRAGLDEISYGVETADDEVLRMLNKRASVEDSVNAVRWAKELGIRVKTYLMVCLPYETWETIEKVKQFMKRSKPDKWTLSTFIPYPGCDIFMDPEQYDVRIIEKDYSKYWLYQDDPVTENIGGADVQALKRHRIDLWKYLVNEKYR